MNERSDEQSKRDGLDPAEALRLTQFAADHAPDAIYWIDETARFVYVNEAACRSLEYTREELLQLGVPDIDPTWPMEHWEAMWQTLRQAGSNKFETVHKTKHGRIFPVEISANFIDYAGRSLDCAYARDISQRKRSEDALRESTQMLKLVMDTIPVAVFWKDRNSVYLGCNYLDAAHAGLASPDEIVGKTDFDMPWRDTEAEGYRAGDRLVMESGIPKLNYEETLHTADGSTIWIRTNKIPLKNADGETIGVMGTFEDITGRKEAERALRSTQFAVDNMSDTAIWVTPDARFIYVNSAATALLGYTREELLAMTIFDVNPHFSPGNWPAHWAEVRERRVMTIEGALRAKDGHMVPVEIRANFVEFEGKQYHYTFVRDISERKAVESERRALEQRLEDHKRKFYQETILSVTDGKLDICGAATVKPYVANAQVKMDVRQASDVVRARRRVYAFLDANGLGGEELCTFMVGVGEAITNSLKHGGWGRVYAGRTGDDLWVTVRDRGPGIESLILPRAVLRRGFSTKPSLGLGYSIMLDVADRILLKTGVHGTAVVLIKSLADSPVPTLANIPDTWETISDVAT